MGNQLTPFIKWPGGKTQELPVIRENLPKKINRFIEPFLGGGSVFFAINHPKSLVNDISTELMSLYGLIAEENTEFTNKLDQINKTWKLLSKLVKENKTELVSIYLNFKSDDKNLDKSKHKNKYQNCILQFVVSNSDNLNGLMNDHFNYHIENFLRQVKTSLYNKMRRMLKIEKEKGQLDEKDIYLNIETAFKAAYYTHFRYLYNNKEKYEISSEFSSALFFFIREYCYSSMFRYNRNGQFNVPYGGMSYNDKDFGKKIEYIKSKELTSLLSTTKLHNQDFKYFVDEIKPSKNDFIFLDPPYDTEFSTYAKNEFSKNDQVRLAEFLNDTEANFMLIIKDTDFIRNLYESYNKFNISKFDKNYMVSFKNRNDKKVEHLLIKNY